MTLTVDELRRYARHLSLPDVGPEGQERLAAARVLLVGAGGLGSPAALYLAAAGIGTIGIVDFDRVDLTNLQRQVLHDTASIGRLKTDSARERIAGLNPHVRVETHETALDEDNGLDLVAPYDLVIDGTDNFRTRYLVNDACVILGKPNVYGSVLRFEGQLAVLATPEGPCYRCLFREPPPPGLVPSCAEGGVLGVLPGLVGTLQATEALKLLLGIGEPMIGRLLLVDALGTRFRTVRVPRDPGCPACGTREIRSLRAEDQACAAPPPPPPRERRGPASAAGMGSPTVDARSGDDARNGGDAPRPSSRDPEIGGGPPPRPTSDARPPAAERPATPRSPATMPHDVSELSPRALHHRLAAGEPLALVDVRESWEVALASIPGARHISLGAVAAEAGSLPRDRDVVLYCHHGMRSLAAAEFLARQGVRAVNLSGGIDAWSREVDPSVPRY